MKRILFASLVMLALGGVSYGQSPVAKTTTKKESVKPANSVNAVSPVTTKSTKTKTSTITKTNTGTKPAGAASTQKVPATAIRKHKKPHHKAKTKKS